MLSAGASPSTSSPTGNYAVSKITVAQVYVLLSTLKAKKDDPAEYENKVNRLNKVRNGYPPVSSLLPLLLLALPPDPMVCNGRSLTSYLCIVVIFKHHLLSPHCPSVSCPLLALLHSHLLP